MYHMRVSIAKLTLVFREQKLWAIGITKKKFRFISKKQIFYCHIVSIISANAYASSTQHIVLANHHH